MLLNEILADQFKAATTETNWVTPLLNSIEELSETDSNWKTTNDTYSVSELVSHLIYWNERHLSRFKEIISEKNTEENSNTFHYENNLNWETRKEKLQTIIQEIMAEIRKMTDEKLQSYISEDIQHYWFEFIYNMNLHNTYHTGQIVLIRKIQRSWNAEKYGVK